MEFRRQEQEEVYNPTPLQQSAFTRPLPSSSTSLLYVRGGGGREGAGDARNGLGSLIQKPTPISAAPAVSGALGGGGGGNRTHYTTAAAAVAATESDTALRYRECLRNHAASLGGHILDGCCEFMRCSDDSLRCAACGCHRSFHRKDNETDCTLCDLQNGTHGRVPLLLPPPHLPPPPLPHHHALKPSGLLLHAGNSAGASVGAATESSSEELMAGAPRQQFIASKKRFRTKFTAEQKESMSAFAEKVGWRMQKQDDAAVQQFCRDVGVSRQVLKVWMHNNKNSSRKQQQQPPPPPPPQQLQQEEEEEEQQPQHEMPED
ncbi:hypothetical protein B296_00020962 [Ensete ventricosum]|uniref:ZF-HD dimerization-type domain-containing protein n=1 Tax=Ensete ventricosum TaxID=4639 RepID=A0A426ZFA7_ENSVE|nr:hypothetical protein B296_00020962 [Ensete ventricosum]